MSIKLILVATDMTERSDRAIARARLIARDCGACLYILHVVDEELAQPIATAEREASEASLQDLRNGPDFSGIDVTVEILPGDPRLTLLDRTETLRPDLVVLGTHRPRGFGDIFEGTTLKYVSRESRHPVLRVTAMATVPYQKPVVGVDFGESALVAARLAMDLAPGAEVTLVHGYHVPYRELTTEADLMGNLSFAETERIEARLRQQMTAFEASLDAPGRSFAKVLAEGQPEDVMRRQVAMLGADLLCLGTHARPWLYEAILGSTTREMLAQCPCDLLLAPIAR